MSRIQIHNFLAVALVLVASACYAAAIPNYSANLESKSLRVDPPKLVVGITVDQMRMDYLYRFGSRFGEGGFKRIMRGFVGHNMHYNFIPTYTAPGHASIYTGTGPSGNGIIGNNWFDKVTHKGVYCVGDPSMTPVGTTDKKGKMSPHRLQATTLGDELNMATQGRSKIIGMSIKDRGAILPAGHSATAAYWFVGKNEGNFISSSYYMNALPGWVQDFNSSSAAEDYMVPWTTMYPIGTYTASGPDNSPHERKFTGADAPVFPHDLAALQANNGGLGMLSATPYGNSLLTDFAIAALANENLGKDKHPDLLAVSYSSTDYVGHQFGANSVEVEDTYLRLDRDLDRLFKELDARVGRDNYVVMLTADHGAVHAPGVLNDFNIPGETFSSSDLRRPLNKFIQQKYKSEKIIEDVSNGQVFFDHRETARLNLNERDMQDAVADFMRTLPNVQATYTRHSLEDSQWSGGQAGLLQNGFSQTRSGDVLYVMLPGVIQYPDTGSTHGSGQGYDTHVPFILSGPGVKPGQSFEYLEITQIAPTLAAMLRITPPSASDHRVITTALKK